MTMDAWEYGNPEAVLMRKQQRAENQKRVCTGCAHKRTIEFRNELVQACALKRGSPTIFCNHYKKENE